MVNPLEFMDKFWAKYKIGQEVQCISVMSQALTISDGAIPYFCLKEWEKWERLLAWLIGRVICKRGKHDLRHMISPKYAVYLHKMERNYERHDQ
jgi:hypothetical protein